MGEKDLPTKRQSSPQVAYLVCGSGYLPSTTTASFRLSEREAIEISSCGTHGARTLASPRPAPRNPGRPSLLDAPSSATRRHHPSAQLSGHGLPPRSAAGSHTASHRSGPEATTPQTRRQAHLSLALKWRRRPSTWDRRGESSGQDRTKWCDELIGRLSPSHSYRGITRGDLAETPNRPRPIRDRFGLRKPRFDSRMEANAPRTTWQVAEEILLDERTRCRLMAYARSRFGIHEEDAKDLLQETALELLRHESYVRRPDGYVFTVFKSRCARFVSARVIDRRILSSGELQAGVRADSLPDAMDRLLAAREALAELSDRCRRLLLAHYLEGQSLRETARTFSVRVGSVEKLVGRCLKRLRECVG